MRKPKGADKWPDGESAAKWLEAIARSIRMNDERGCVFKLDLKVTKWNPSWETKPKRPRRQLKEAV
jgi:hypothetical protein